MMNEQSTEVIGLTGADAFSALRLFLEGDGESGVRFREPIFARLHGALTPAETASQTSSLDVAILVRQALRYYHIQMRTADSPTLWIPQGGRWPSEEQWRSVGVTAIAEGTGYRLTALPWKPNWLPNVGEDGADAAAVGESPRLHPGSIPGDPFLASLGHNKYKSLGQQAAVRAALTTPPAATLMVALPTGEGKSLVFQAVARMGFGEGRPGVTLVVTPTVTLALDHERTAQQMGFKEPALAHLGGETERNAGIRQRIVEGQQTLCFAAPEAVCGSLRDPLTQAAANGLLRAIVLDEAHLVDMWGANFRPEYQVLAGIRRAFLAASPQDCWPRTFLLSATLTEQAVATLRMLFATDAHGLPGPFGVSAALRLRPEIDYWAAPICGYDERQKRVMDAMLHLPRPAILYVTERKNVQSWHQALQQQGFRRLAWITSESSIHQRQETVRRWRSGDIDLVVATSAFGLGIDNPNVRAVVHACIPETYDRFYQEVGRGGRDGTASISLLIPEGRDRKTASGMNKRRLLSVKIAHGRWSSMFNHEDRRVEGPDLFSLPMDVSPGNDPKHIDMVGKLNTQWNVRTLNLMAGAGMLTLMGAESEPPDNDNTAEPRRLRQTVRITDGRHLDSAWWEQVVEPYRHKLDVANHDNLQRMLWHLSPRSCVAELLSPLYELSSGNGAAGAGVEVGVARACGGCPHCRAAGRSPYDSPPVKTPFPWSGRPLAGELAKLLSGPDNHLVVFYPANETWDSRRWQRRFCEGLGPLVQAGVRSVVALKGLPTDLLAELQHLVNQSCIQPLFAANRLFPSDLPLGPSIVVAPQGWELSPYDLSRRQPENTRLFFLPDNIPDPSMPSVLLRTRYSGHQLDWDQFLDRVNS
ncbi:MAG: ATP-dependent DNA helicase RecQ [Gammaproteobacteria bacterium]|nr:ATP-dependent DNA helicase RecQ [Gammaproteobacteria bacterium]